MQRATATLATALLLPLMLAGCTDGGGSLFEDAPAKCTKVVVPPLRGGDRITYRIEGDLATPTTGPTLIDFRDVEPERAPDHPGLFAFPPDSELRIDVATTTTPRLAASGDMVESRRIAYTAHPAAFSGAVHGLDEWLAADGLLVQTHMRQVEIDPDAGARHAIRTTGLGAPAAMLGQLVAGQTLDAAWRAEATLPAETLPMGGETTPGTLEAAVVRISGAPCRATIEVRIQWPDVGDGSLADAYGTYSVRIDMNEEAPLPARYVTNWTGDLAAHPLVMELASYEPVAGEVVPSFRAAGTPTPTYEMHPAIAGFPPDPTCAYGTCLHDALANLSLHPQVAAWFQVHPGAGPLWFNHRQGATDGPYRDEWTFAWGDGTERLVATYRPPRLDGPPTQPTAAANIVVVETGAADEQTDAPQSLPDIATLARIQTAALGGTPEVVRCDYVTRSCSLTTHEESGIPPLTSADQPVQTTTDGILIDLDTGLVIQVNLRGPTLL